MLDHFQVIWTWNARVIIVVTASLCQGSKSHSFLHSNLTFAEVSGMLMLNRFRLYLSNKFYFFVCARGFSRLFSIWLNTLIFQDDTMNISEGDEKNTFPVLISLTIHTRPKWHQIILLVISFLFFSFHFISWNSIVQFYCIGGKGEGGRERSNINKVRSMETLRFKWLICNTLC